MKKNYGNKFRNTLISIVKYIFLAIVSFLSIFPFYWMFIGSTNKTTDITRGKMTIGTELFNNFSKLTKVSNIGQAFFNTVKLTIIYTVLVILISSMAAYGFEKFRSKGKEKVYSVFLLSMMVPFAAMMIPLFRLIVKMGLLNSHVAVILPGLASAFLVFFFRQNFKSFPTEIIEAARIDGAKELFILFRIVAPPMKSTFAAAAIISFMTQWNNFLWPLIVLQTDKTKTLTLVISSLSSAYFVDYGILMLAIVIATLPIILLFVTMQKQFVEGMIGCSK